VSFRAQATLCHIVIVCTMSTPCHVPPGRERSRRGKEHVHQLDNSMSITFLQCKSRSWAPGTGSLGFHIGQGRTGCAEDRICRKLSSPDPMDKGHGLCPSSLRGMVMPQEQHKLGSFLFYYQHKLRAFLIPACNETMDAIRSTNQLVLPVTTNPSLPLNCRTQAGSPT
jgi:hypothetical protein